MRVCDNSNQILLILPPYLSWPCRCTSLGQCPSHPPGPQNELLQHRPIFGLCFDQQLPGKPHSSWEKMWKSQKNMKKPWCPIESYRCSRIPPGKFSHNPPRTAAQRRRPGASVKARRSNTAPSGAVRVIRRLQLLV